jgi:peptidoglycan/LPS O-acetylase OafA/YrhL
MKQLEAVGCQPLLTLFLGTALAIGIGAAITFWFEQPISKYLRRNWTNLKTQFEDARKKRLSSVPSAN